MPMTTITADDLPLQRIYRWERERASQPWFTQPVGTDGVRIHLGAGHGRNPPPGRMAAGAGL